MPTNTNPVPQAMARRTTTDHWQSRWQALDQWLAAFHQIWLPAPFAEPAPEWRSRYPDTAAFLEALDDAAVARFEADPAGLIAALPSELSGLAARAALIDLPRLDGTDQTLPETRAVDMPGRKRQQAGAFAGAIQPLRGPLLDWCCGKGHLARTLAPLANGPLTGWEWNPALVDAGNALARHYDDPVTLITQDVLADDLVWPAPQHGVALHACGDLHRRLIRGAAARDWPRVSLSPCCFHLTACEHYRPLSERAAEQSSVPPLSRPDLRLAVRETVTAPARVRRQTSQTQCWRLGFDALQRDLQQADVYLPLPSHPPELNNADFAAFCRWAAQERDLAVPADVDFDHWLAEGKRRQRQVRRHELLRHLFRRPLEVWMVLDYALYLEEQGYRVRLGTFCERRLTPRNLLLDAVRY